MFDENFFHNLARLQDFLSLTQETIVLLKKIIEKNDTDICLQAIKEDNAKVHDCFVNLAKRISIAMDIPFNAIQLTGSRSSGLAHPFSDIDCAVIGYREEQFNRFLAFIEHEYQTTGLVIETSARLPLGIFEKIQISPKELANRHFLFEVTLRSPETQTVIQSAMAHFNQSLVLAGLKETFIISKMLLARAKAVPQNQAAKDSLYEAEQDFKNAVRKYHLKGDADNILKLNLSASYKTCAYADLSFAFFAHSKGYSLNQEQDQTTHKHLQAVKP